MKKSARERTALIIGGGHNGLVCAAYLAAGDTLVLEGPSTVFRVRQTS